MCISEPYAIPDQLTLIHKDFQNLRGDNGKEIDDKNEINDKNEIDDKNEKENISHKSRKDEIQVCTRLIETEIP